MFMWCGSDFMGAQFGLMNNLRTGNIVSPDCTMTPPALLGC